MNSHNSPGKTSKPVFKSIRLMDQLREQIRYLHYSLRTEEAYVYWAKKFVRFHGLKHPRDMGQLEVEAFLTFLATQGRVFSFHPPAGFERLAFFVPEGSWHGLALDVRLGASGGQEAHSRGADKL